MTDPIVPRQEPEVIQAGAAKCWHGDSEKVATTSLQQLKVDGVVVSSRYDKAHELNDMAAMLKVISSQLRSHIVSVLCDSKACAAYIIELNACNVAKARTVANHLERACLETSGGHNGMSFSGPAGRSLYLDPRWRGDDLKLETSIK